jgi:hypothetical protein
MNHDSQELTPAAHTVDHRALVLLLAAEPNIGAGDESKCLPGWIRSFCEWLEAGKGVTLSHNAVSALAHTLIAARERAARLVRERDELRRSTSNHDPKGS